ncbi:MAG: energy transducer TonB [Polaribacter sp.]|nr:energy transducer TonB [Polaribacter sp.]
MEIKKNPKYALENYSKIFFQIGLVFTLFCIYTLMEHKTYENTSISSLGKVNMIEQLEEEIPIVNMRQAEPPRNTPQVIEVVKIVNDDLNVEESIIETTETDQTEAVSVNKSTNFVVGVKKEEEEIIEDVPFLLIQDVPIFPGCTGTNKELKDCFSQKVAEFFNKKFDPNIAQELGLSEGKKKIFLVFTICNKGKVIDIKVRGPHPKLEEEVVGIISSLPQMKPGKQGGKAVKVSYSLPITFEVVQ